ncbi:hypothetical protein FB451DRAFT_1264943 [Mycena latifolia]|nr:hypothetical protein FB451DRAFT_1264943 [Mycena latifolia]
MAFSAMNTGRTPALPPELEREIFEIAALLHAPSMPALLRVARRVKVWIEPMLYLVLSITRDTGRPLQISLGAVHRVMDEKPAAFFHRHLQFLNGFTADEIIDILSACKNTVNLDISGVARAPSLLPLLGQMPLQRLSANLPPPFPSPGGIDFSHPLFSQITHLDVSMFHMPWGTWATGLALLPQLTHLSFHHPHPPHSACQHILQGCERLQVFVLLYRVQYYVALNLMAREQLATDPRFIMLSVESASDDWVVGARTGEDFWVRAEALLKEKTGKTNLNVLDD